MKRRLLLFLTSLVGSMAVFAQNTTVSIQDTLPEVVKVAALVRQFSADRYRLDPLSVQHLVSPLGMGDAVKYIQTLPGVSTGGEGGSAYYVRGGSHGANLVTIDGVSLYGVSHLLGFTTAYPEEIIKTADFHTGGFDSEEGNLTASHLRLMTRDGDYCMTQAGVSLTPFLLSAHVSGPIVKDKVSYLGSVRISPIGVEYKALRGIFNRYQNTLRDFGLMVGDFFSKISYQKDSHNKFSFSLFGNLDRYAFRLNDLSDDSLGWGNVIANLSWDCSSTSVFDRVYSSFSFNGHSGVQSQETSLNGSNIYFMVRSTLDELTFLSTAEKRWDNWSTQFGYKIRGASFNPGSSQVFEDVRGNNVYTMIVSLHGQLEYGSLDKFLFKMALRGNLYGYGLLNNRQTGWMCHPEMSLMARINLTKKLGIETTVDYLTQYYHTLEGIPLGWSLDMLIPSDTTNPPERVVQVYGGLYGVFNKNRFRSGGFFKQMAGLVYYGDATSFFSSALSGWHENISIGEGVSYGAELMYERVDENLSWRASYTWSKTDRFFADLNRGRRFPARYDRRHIANLSLDGMIVKGKNKQLGISSFFTYQSGSWDTLQDGFLPGFIPIYKELEKLPYISSLHNYELPAYIRWDVALRVGIKGRNARQDIGIGVYNLLNRHNPFMLRYDSEAHEWNYVSLIPIIPNISYQISF